MISSTVLSRKLVQRYTELVQNFYMEPPDDDSVCTFAETPVAFIDFNIPSTSKGKGRRNEKICKCKKKKEILSRRTLEASLEAQLLQNRVAH